MVTKTSMSIDDIIDIVCSNSLVYPGNHQESSERTKISMPKLNINSQLKLIWKTFCEYTFHQLINNIGVTVDNFGTFSFTYVNNLPTKTQQSFYSSLTNLNTLNIKKLAFVLSSKYQSILNHYSSLKTHILQPKQVLITKPVITWNPTSIGYSCYLKKEVVFDGINAILKVVHDMVKMKKKVDINTGFCKILFNKGEMSYYYYDNNTTIVNNK